MTDVESIGSTSVIFLGYVHLREDTHLSFGDQVKAPELN